MRALLYISGAGYYQCKLNGVLIDAHVMGPTTDFWSRLYYETYDVSELIMPGSAQVLSCMLGKGRYGQIRNSIGERICGSRRGCQPALLAKLSLHLGDGAKQAVVSDASWKSLESPVLADDLFQGETFNTSLDTAEFDLPRRIDDSELAGVLTNGTSGFMSPWDNVSITSSYLLPPIRVVKTAPAVDLWQVPSGDAKGEWVFDFG